MSKHLIKNFKSLAKSAMRRDALAMLEAGIKAVDPRRSILRAVKRRGDFIFFGNKKINLKNFDHIYVIAIGKAAGQASVGLEKILGPKITGGIALDIKKTKLKYIKSIVGTHPMPSEQNMRATGEIIAMLKNLDSRDLVLAVISGGGSSLLCWPYELKCDDLSAISRALMQKGATIEELNIVRKHLSEIQGGQFARLVHPATLIGMIFSDVPGDDIGLVASGPTVRDTSTVTDAAKILTKYKVLKVCSLPDCDLKETPKDEIYFKKVFNFLVASNKEAVSAMVGEARKRGWKTRVLGTKIVGEARDVGRMMAASPVKSEAVIAAGETTVTILGRGAGGRNQELALGALDYLDYDALVASAASDGVDNGPAAGAIADKITKDKARALGISPKKYLAKNDSFAFFKKTGDGISTGITGTNVSDLMIALRK